MCDRNGSGIPVNEIALAVQSASPAPVRVTCPRCGGSGWQPPIALANRCALCNGNGTVPAEPPAPARAITSAPAHAGCSLMLAEVQEWAARHPATSITGTALHLARLACDLGDYPAAASVGRICAAARELDAVDLLDPVAKRPPFNETWCEWREEFSQAEIEQAYRDVGKTCTWRASFTQVVGMLCGHKEIPEGDRDGLAKLNPVCAGAEETIDCTKFIKVTHVDGRHVNAPVVYCARRAIVFLGSGSSEIKTIYAVPASSNPSVSPFDLPAMDAPDNDLAQVRPLAAFMLLNCTNVSSRETQQPQPKRRAGDAGSQVKRAAYHVLVVNVPAGKGRPAGQDGTGQARHLPFHVVRGHLKNLQAERYVNKRGPQWWPPHWRGDPEIGVVAKSYAEKSSVSEKL